MITKRGRLVAVLSPTPPKRTSFYGDMKGRIEILGDIISPIDVAWNAEQ